MLIKILEPNFKFWDIRGNLTQLVRKGFSQFNIIQSVTGSLRGGHYHKINSEAFYIISGRIRLEAWNLERNIYEEYEFSSGEMFEIPPNIPHSFYFVSETILASMYSQGVELQNGSKDIYISETPDIKITKIEIPLEEFYIIQDENEFNNITTLMLEINGEFINICERKIKLWNQRKFSITFDCKLPADCRVRWYVLRSKKITLKIDYILCSYNEKVMEVDKSTIYYHEGEIKENDMVDIVSIDPCIDFTTPSIESEKVIIYGEWFIEENFQSFAKAFYKRINDFRHIMENEIKQAIVLKEKHIEELELECKEAYNEINRVKKKNEKLEIHVDLLKQDIEEIIEKEKKNEKVITENLNNQEEDVKVMQTTKKVWIEYLRFIAIFLVLYGHFIGTGTWATSIPYVIHSINEKNLPIIPIGTHIMSKLAEVIYIFHLETPVLGVILFFVISGYLSVKTRKKYDKSSNFLIYKFIHLFPGLLIANVIGYISVLSMQGIYHAPIEIISSILMITPLVAVVPILPVTWFIYVEIVYIYIISRVKNIGIIFYITVTMIIYIMIFIYQFSHSVHLSVILYYMKYLPIIFSGVILALTENKGWKKYIYYGGSLFLAWLTIKICSYVIEDTSTYTNLKTFIAVFMIFIVIIEITKKLQIRKVPRIIQLVNESSYFIYLLQINVGMLLMYELKMIGLKNAYINVLVSTIVLVIVSYLLHKSVELPMQRKLKLWTKL